MSKAITRTFSKEFLKEVLWEDAEGTKIIQNEIFNQGRWSTYYYLVFSFEDKLYGIVYSRGSTEIQDEGPFADEGDQIIVNEVEAKEKIIIEYVSKKKES